MQKDQEREHHAKRQTRREEDTSQDVNAGNETKSKNDTQSKQVRRCFQFNRQTKGLPEASPAVQIFDRWLHRLGAEMEDDTGIVPGNDPVAYALDFHNISSNKPITIHCTYRGTCRFCYPQSTPQFDCPLAENSIRVVLYNTIDVHPGEIKEPDHDSLIEKYQKRMCLTYQPSP